jgi:hypothetical protein
MQLLQAANQSNTDNPNNARCGHLRNKKMEYLKDNVNEI